MALEFNWVGEERLEQVARTRMLCYAHAGKDFEAYLKRTRENPAARPGDYLLVEQAGAALGTATSLSMTLWARGAAIPCQGVAWVGTMKTHRRKTQAGDGVATRLMRELLRKAREREQVVSALMPFRGSFYEHFGYGFVERRNEWTVPLAVLPHGEFEGVRFVEPTDLPELVNFRQRVVEHGQCDIERPADVWRWQLAAQCDAGFVVVDRPAPAGPIRSFLSFQHERVETKDVLRIVQINYEDISALRRQLHFLASLRDQYHTAVLTLPVDLPLNWLLRETQLPHRLVNHAHAQLRQDVRMQVRVLDHKRFIEAMHLPESSRGRAVISVQESEGSESRFEIDLSDGRGQVRPSAAAAEFTCPTRVWSAIACADLPASRAVQLGLATGENASAAALLDALAVGPAPFCHEYF